MTVFKNALCGDPIPDAYGYAYGAFPCRRRNNHPGKHRRVFKDGGIREWSDGDRESVLAKEAVR